MNNPIEMIQPDAKTQARFEKIAQGLKKRHAASRRLKTYGIMAIVTAISFLAILLTTIISNGYTAIQQTELQIALTIPAEKLQNGEGAIDPVKARNFNWNGLIKKAFRAEFPDVTAMLDKRALGEILSKNAGYDLRRQIEAKGVIPTGGTKLWIKTSDDVDMLMKGRLDRNLDESQRRLSDQQIGWIDKLVADDRVRLVFNDTFFTAADSREPESAGVLGATVGSAMALFVTVLLALPLAVMAAVYLEYFARLAA